MSSDLTMPQQEKNLFFRVKCVFFIVISIAITYRFLFVGLPEFVRSWTLVNEGAVAVSLSPWVLPFVIGSPVMLLLAWALVLRLVDRDTGKHYQFTLQAAIVVGIVAIVARLPMGFILDGYLTSKNYSYCYWYTPPANFSPPVWVSKPQFCIEQTGHIRKMLVEWLQAQPNAGHDLSLLDVQQKVAELNAAHKAGEFVY